MKVSVWSLDSKLLVPTPQAMSTEIESKDSETLTATLQNFTSIESKTTKLEVIYCTFFISFFL